MLQCVSIQEAHIYVTACKYTVGAYLCYRVVPSTLAGGAHLHPGLCS